MVNKVLRGEYFRGESIWTMRQKSGDSWIWRSILSAKDLLERGIKKRVGDGQSINIWKDK